MRLPFCLLLVAAALAAETADEAFTRSLRSERGGDYAAARAALAPFERRLSGDYLYQVRLGWLALCAGDAPAALASYRSAQRLAPASLEPRLGQARALLVAQAWSDAEAAARQVLQLDPLNYTGTQLLVAALRAQARPDAARRALDQLLERYPSDTALLALAASASDEWGHADEARAFRATAARLDPDAKAAVAGR
jgi:tetratricopeptide (TPR) repeat protein